MVRRGNNFSTFLIHWDGGWDVNHGFKAQKASDKIDQIRIQPPKNKITASDYTEFPYYPSISLFLYLSLSLSNLYC